MSTCESPFKDSIWDLHSDIFSSFLNQCNFILFVIFLVSLLYNNNNKLPLLLKILLTVLILRLSKPLYSLAIFTAYFFACCKYQWLMSITLTLQFLLRLCSYFKNKTKNLIPASPYSNEYNKQGKSELTIKNILDENVNFVTKETDMRGALLENVSIANNFSCPRMQRKVEHAVKNPLLDLVPDISSPHLVTDRDVTRSEISASGQPGDTPVHSVTDENSGNMQFSSEQAAAESISERFDEASTPGKKVPVKKRACKRQINYYPPKRKNRQTRMQ